MGTEKNRVNQVFPTVAFGDSLDWKDLEPSAIYDRVTKRVNPGSIVLFHNAAKNTPAALPQILEKLTGDGYKIIPISQLIYKENYKIDNAGKQIPIATQPVN